MNEPHNQLKDATMSTTEAATRSANNLMSMINRAVTPSDLYEVAKTIATIMNNTEGFWVELNFCYKAAEIAKKVSDVADYFIILGVFPIVEKKLSSIKIEMRTIADRYHALQQEYMNSVVEHCNAG